MSTSTKSAQKVVFGAMPFGRQGTEQARVHDIGEAREILNLFKAHGHTEIDTARLYGEGSSEEYVGDLTAGDSGLIIATKVAPYTPWGGAIYSHRGEGLRASLTDSLKALKADQVDLWYLHGPDHKIPYEETLSEVNKLYNEGLFKRFGISNYSAWEVAQMSEIIDRNGWKKIDVYQGVYNALLRVVEPELLPCLRHYGISFYQYNPLAGGFLTDRYQRDDSSVDDNSRFDPKRQQGAMYRARYWNDTYFDALDKVRPLAKKLGITTAEAALRWSIHHSQLKPECNDAIIISASSVKQLEQNLAALEKGPLLEELVEAFDEAWGVAKVLAKPYFF